MYAVLSRKNSQPRDTPRSACKQWHVLQVAQRASESIVMKIQSVKVLWYLLQMNAQSTQCQADVNDQTIPDSLSQLQG